MDTVRDELRDAAHDSVGRSCAVGRKADASSASTVHFVKDWVYLAEDFLVAVYHCQLDYVGDIEISQAFELPRLDLVIYEP
ncbi:hypothetical protein EAD96_04490 [Micromonospora sp. BL1]|nr:hypothetical protein EAD96_04490 [Micromonospora sp. BL1]